MEHTIRPPAQLSYRMLLLVRPLPRRVFLRLPDLLTIHSVQSDRLVNQPKGDEIHHWTPC